MTVTLVAGCAEPASDSCGNGTFCPPSTTCGAQNVCFADVDACPDFANRTPCIIDRENSGYCEEGTCERGPDVIASAAVMPSRMPAVGIEGVVRDHPEVLRSIGNANGYFGFRTPRDITIVIEARYPDALISVTRPIVVADRDVLADYIYGGIPIVPTALVELLSAQLDITFQPDRGVLAGSAFDVITNREVAGMSVTVPPGTCLGPYYFGVSGAVEPGATATQEGGAFAFVDCVVGPTTVTATSPAGPCRTLDADAPGDIAAEIEPDRLLFVGRIVCGQ